MDEQKRRFYVKAPFSWEVLRLDIKKDEIEKLEVFVSHSWIILTQAY